MAQLCPLYVVTEHWRDVAERSVIHLLTPRHICVAHRFKGTAFKAG